MQMFVVFLMSVLSVLTPTKSWYPPSAPIEVNVSAEAPAKLMLTDFTGRLIEPVQADGALVEGNKAVDVRAVFGDALSRVGTYVLWVVPRDAVEPTQFAGTPLVIEVRVDRRDGAPEGPLVVKVTPLRYATMQTEAGAIDMAFYYDVAPHTVSNFLQLAEEGYFNGLAFHRIVPGFVIQGGDPRGDGSGGPGYTIPEEFNNRPHLEGVLSMARQGDPNERAGAMPRREFADSAGSQFFICLDYSRTRNLDNRYTAFGQVTSGIDAVRKIAQTQVTGDKPVTPPLIQKVEVKNVTRDQNPYADLMRQIAIMEQKAQEPAR
jgi:cyclophilin family peptidyl-prolyl cis-trans isomerase